MSSPASGGESAVGGRDVFRDIFWCFQKYFRKEPCKEGKKRRENPGLLTWMRKCCLGTTFRKETMPNKRIGEKNSFCC